MTAIVVKFPRPTKASPARPPSSLRIAGVCRHCFARRPDVVDFSSFGLGKWCDGCLPVLEEALEKIDRPAI
jgi:hypothetical protein